MDERRPIPGYGDILLVEAEGASLSHALQLRVERPRARGLWLRGAYTWGKSIDDGSAFLASEGNDNTPQWSARPDLERGLSDYDVRHRGVVAAIWEVPAMGGKALGRDWQVSALLSLQSGRPFTPRVTSDNSNTGNLGGQFGYDRPDEVPLGTPGAVTYDGRAFQIARALHVRLGRPQHPHRPGLGEPRPRRSRRSRAWAAPGGSKPAPRSTTCSIARTWACPTASWITRRSGRVCRRGRDAWRRSPCGSRSDARRLGALASLARGASRFALGARASADSLRSAEARRCSRSRGASYSANGRRRSLLRVVPI